MRGGVSAAVDAMAERFNTRCAAACLLCPWYPAGVLRDSPWYPAGDL
jgi:hypothetical protein